MADVHKSYGISLEDIAAQIGDSNSTVQRMYGGLMIVLRAESAGLLSRDDTTNARFYFNYIYTGPDYNRRTLA